MEQSKKDSESGVTYGEYAGIKYWYYMPSVISPGRTWIAIYTVEFPMFAVPTHLGEIDTFMFENFLDACIEGRLKDDLGIHRV